jgi:hypothetical protein
MLLIADFELVLSWFERPINNWAIVYNTGESR